ncbi:MAG: GAF domain-containing sensor histidine kinase [Methanomicrobia archaeon]|nr:GAF domain-containing sensor histidine kinase [Methanomicrobia archaeon]
MARKHEKATKEILEDILEKKDLPEILNKVTSTVGTLFGYRRVALTLWDENFDVRYATFYGLEEEEIKTLKGRIMSREERKLVLNEKYRISNSYFIPEEDNPMIKKALPGDSIGEWKSLDALIVPLRVKGKVIGMISIDEPISGKRPTEESLKNIEIFADQASLAIENEKMIKREIRFAQKLKILNNISRELSKLADLENLFHRIPELIKETYDLPFVGLGIFDGKNIIFKHYSTQFKKINKTLISKLKRGLIGWAAYNKKTLCVKDVSKDPRYRRYFEETKSELVIPILSEGNLLGVLDFQSNEINYFSPEDILVLESLTDQIAITLRNSQLFEKIKNEKKMQEFFVSVVSHDLKTPLQVILGYADLLKNDKYARIIQENVKKINETLDKASLYSKLEAGYKENPEMRNIKLIIEDLISNLENDLNKRNIKVILDLEELRIESFSVLEDIFQNLIENAIKFAPEDSKIEIYSENYERYIVISVKNYGQKIPDGKKEEVFERFKKLDLRTKGTGLGLAIVKEAVALHNGEVWIEDSPDGGTVFKVKLPKGNFS